MLQHISRRSDKLLHQCSIKCVRNDVAVVNKQQPPVCETMVADCPVSIIQKKLYCRGIRLNETPRTPTTWATEGAYRVFSQQKCEEGKGHFITSNGNTVFFSSHDTESRNGTIRHGLHHNKRQNNVDTRILYPTASEYCPDLCTNSSVVTRRH